MFTQYHNAVSALERIIHTEQKSYMESKSAQDFFLLRTQHLFDQLGNPERGFKYIHVAGSSGKGSTSTMIYEILHAAGYDVGLYLTPYVTTPIENIHARGQLIHPNDFAHHVNALLQVVERIQKQSPDLAPSYSEVFFAVAIQYFQSIGCEWIVIETGCGGRFDKTNIIPMPRVVALTSIGLDHTEVLGKTLEEIAWQKAGIIKPGAGIFTSETKDTVLGVFDAEAKKTKSTVHRVTEDHALPDFETAMPGEHQQVNASLAQAVARHIGIQDEAILQGIGTARLPARVELMQQHPRVIVDGAHSEQKIRALVQAVRHMDPWNKLHLLFAAKENKNIHELLKPLVPLIDSAVMTSFVLPGFGSVRPADAAAALQDLKPGITCVIEEDAKRALDSVLQCAEPEDMVLITGSLYLAGELRQHWISEDDILRYRSIFPDQRVLKSS